MQGGKKVDNRLSGHIRKMKKPYHNVYGLSHAVYRGITTLCISLWIVFLLEVEIRHLPAVAQYIIAAASLVPALIAFYMAGRKTKIEMTPYCRKDGFEFLGLHNLKDSALDNQHDILSRDEEIAYMHRVLEDVIFPQSSVKQALCIAGPSGCGKSTIMSFFRQAYKEEYSIFDFSGNYHELYGHMVALFGTNIDQKISEMTTAGKAVFILDQFERYFFLQEEEQKRIRETIQYLCRKNSAIIVSLREEYLADFLKQFDMNNLLSSDGEADIVPRGILKEMVSVIEKKDKKRDAASMLIRPSKTVVWEYHRIKNNATIHLDASEKGSGREILEEMGATLLYCRNQNDTNAQLQGRKTNASILESKCRLLFGDRGSMLFHKHAYDPLIEQQIIFHMAEFNQKILSYSEEELTAFVDQDNNELFGQYFDIQLASCNSFFHASRLLYLLSQARLHQLSIGTMDIENCLFPTLFTKRGHELLMKTILQLEQLQLIRKNTEGSGLEYEIAHDFIASTFLNYCSTNMNRSIKNALDLFIAEYMDKKRNISMREKNEYREKVYPQRYFINATAFAIILMFVAYIVERFVFNPWTTIWSGANPYGSYVPAFPLFITGISVIYLCCMYNKTVKYYRGNKAWSIKVIYVLLMFLATTAVFAYPHYLFFDGIDLAIAALYIAFLLDNRYQNTCRNELFSYGTKSCLIGSILAFGHVFFLLVNRRYDDYLILTEFIMFTVLVAYAFMTHITQEFLYARMTDASSEKL